MLLLHFWFLITISQFQTNSEKLVIIVIQPHVNNICFRLFSFYDFVFHCLSSLAAPGTANGSVMRSLSSENCGFEILDYGRTTNDFIDNKIEELGSGVSITTLEFC